MDAREIIWQTHQAGIRVLLSIIVGSSSETKGRFRRTLDFIKRNLGLSFCIVSLSECWMEDVAYLHIHQQEFDVKLKQGGEP